MNTKDSDDEQGSCVKVTLIRAFLLLVGSAILLGGVALVCFPPAPYLDMLGIGCVLIFPYFLWLALIADNKTVKKSAIDIADRIF
jgi:hypothetical protein